MADVEGDRGNLPLVAALMYALSPIDLVPDIMPVLGLLDDLGVGGVALALAWRAQRRGQASAEVGLALVVALIYAVLPLDLIPDIIPLLGRADDVIVTLLLTGMSWLRRRRVEIPDEPR